MCQIFKIFLNEYVFEKTIQILFPYNLILTLGIKFNFFRKQLPTQIKKNSLRWFVPPNENPYRERYSSFQTALNIPLTIGTY
ncbi:hypothetical protein BpHYR1_054149 [Brachionus plicatilis]|uniref:Uncharacterized protein n=1 Tax=Brachionus plicatilis TaxID=10195 RepID=A0A3M7S8S4_BRAPC|nr:hypothetical protein BpHYR1_054149 [Brachionus plicatilis]